MRDNCVVSEIFKGIALFTPGGDLIYCLDPLKKSHWHLDLCIALQDILSLPEPPHFLVPGYTATVDRWLDPQTQKIKTFAEIYPAVQKYKSLLNVAFGTEELVWQVADWQEEYCNPIILETYRHQFPQLWESHELIIYLEREKKPLSTSTFALGFSDDNSMNLLSSSSLVYVLRLFVSGTNINTQKTLETIYQLLEKNLSYPYTLKVIDISKHPEQAENNNIAATPTLVRLSPQPVKRIVGELTDVKRILQILTTN